jgi:hypothetical protein
MAKDKEKKAPKDNNPSKDSDQKQKTPKKPEEIGGPKGPEPTRYGDWEKDGRCSDF